jgi:hypothetical protein
MSSDKLEVYRISPTGELAAAFPLAQVPETAALNAHVFQSLAVGPDGEVFVPITWSPRQRELYFGLAVFSAAGAYAHTITLEPNTEIRHAAVDVYGNIYALGIDAPYFRRRAASCFLLHKYSPDGKRVASFSECPTTELSWLQEDVDRGVVWVRDSRLYHVLSLSLKLRVFDLEGELLREVTFQPPEGPQASGARVQIWRLAELPDGRFLIEWLRSEMAGSRTMSNVRLQSVHDRSGVLVSLPEEMSADPGTLLFADESGYCYFLGKDQGGAWVLRKAGVRVE